MMFSIGQITVASIILSLVGLLLGHWLSKRRNRQKFFNEAANRFRETFTSEIQSLQRGNQSVYLVFTPGVFDRHEEAMLEFKSFVKVKDRRRFEEAWQEYRNYYQSKDVSTIERLAAVAPEDAKKDRENALEHINKLLSFAEQK